MSGVAPHPATDPPALVEEYERHAALKEAGVRAALAPHGLDGLFGGLVRCPVERGFRTQASFRVRASGVAGVDPRTGPVPLEQALWTIPEGARPTVERIAEVLRESEGDEAAAVTGFELRLEHGSLRTHVGLAARREAGVRLEPLVARLWDAVPELLGVGVASQGIETGESWLRNELRGRTVLAHHLAFFQTNAHVTPLLVDEVRRGVGDEVATAVDLYCGAGMHSLLAAAPETRVEGADNNRWAIESAARNVELHGLAHARYHRVSAEAFCRERHFDAPQVVFVNPSRFGCGPGVAESVAAWRPRVVCLVSCSVASHVRDTLAFAAAGLRPVSVRCFDMFPFSEYLESAGFFVPA